MYILYVYSCVYMYVILWCAQKWDNNGNGARVAATAIDEFSVVRPSSVWQRRNASANYSACNALLIISTAEQ